MDYEKIAAAAVQAMKGGDLNRFLVVCAVVSDLYCPGYNPRQSLAKDTNLARTASRYKIDAGKAASAARTELSGKKGAKAAEKKNKTSSSAQSRRSEASKVKK